MKVYFVYSENYEDILQDAEVPIIISYGRLKRNLVIPRKFSEIMIDSGGYQLQTGTATRDVCIGAYALWLNIALAEHPELKYYFNLDHWRDGEGTLANQIFLENEGLHPLPIWHAGTDLYYLDYYCANYEYVGIGGIANIRNRKELQKMSTWLFQTHRDTKFHLLGVGLAGISSFRTFKPHSIDFSTWVSPARFGHHVITDKKAILKEVKLPDDIALAFRTDKALEREYIKKAVDLIKQLDELTENIHDPYQGLLF